MHRDWSFLQRARPACLIRSFSKGQPTGITDFVRQCRAMASQRKPVIVRKFSRDWCAGYAGVNFGQDAAELEILDQGGKVVWIAWKQVKWVCYVRDFPAGETANPERLLHKRFS